jgi:hypothetical protein
MRFKKTGFCQSILNIPLRVLLCRSGVESPGWGSTDLLGIRKRCWGFSQGLLENST